MTPRVLHLVDSFRAGGSERQAIQLARLLKRSGRYSIRIASLNDEGPLREEVAALGFDETPSYPLNCFYDGKAVKQLVRFAGYLKEEKIDIVHTHCFYTNIFGMTGAAMARVPVRLASRRESFKRAEVDRFVERIAYRLAHRVIVNCEEVRHQLATEGVTTEKIVTLYNGLDLSRVEPARTTTRKSALEALGLPPDGNRRFVTALANIREVKDQPTFIRAARRVREAVPEAAFILAGGGDSSDQGAFVDHVRQLAAKLGLEGDTFFLGRCDNVAELLQISDVCVLSSKSEGFSNSILEYMAARRPVVATCVGGAREAIVEGETGYLVPVGDDRQMADYVIALLRDPNRAREMGERGRQIVERNFSCQTQLNRIEQVYDELLNRTNGESVTRSRACHV